jgi:hypothetical protein
MSGKRSCAPDDRVRFLGLPFSIGTVKMSPRALKTARSPLGLSPNHEMRLPTFTWRGRLLIPSSGTVIETLDAFFDPTSRISSSPLRS